MNSKSQQSHRGLALFARGARRHRFAAVIVLVACALAANHWLTVAAAKAPPASTPAATEAKDAAKPDAAKDAPAAEGPKVPPTTYINQMIRDGWSARKLTPAKAATDGEWCRRVYLDIIGRIPRVKELEEFLGDRSPDRKAKLVGRLLGDEYAAEYARNFTTLWTTILIGRNGGMEERTVINREGMQKYLRDSFVRNKPYHRMVHELVSATGDTAPGAEQFNGATNFLVGKLDEMGAQATAKTAQVFLGLQIQCTQCHNHPFNDWKQNRFWEMNAFFRQTRALRSFNAGTDRIRAVRLANEDFGGEGGSPDKAEIYYELRNGLMKVAYPVFVDGTAINPSGYLQDCNRRKELADLIVKSEWMPKAIVNRMWGHFLGYGFTKPIDDIGPHNPPTHPELFDRLAKDFAYGGHDIKELIRWITLSEPYSLSSRITSGNKADEPNLGEKPAFSRFYLRQMRAEELYESLITATSAEKTGGSYEQQEATKRDWLRQFVVAFGTDDLDETTTFNGSIPQALMMMNGDLVNKACNCEPGSFLHTVATNARLSNAARINYLYVAALSRTPNANELAVANKLLGARQGNIPAALQDIWWVVLNTNEFILNH